MYLRANILFKTEDLGLIYKIEVDSTPQDLFFQKWIVSYVG